MSSQASDPAVMADALETWEWFAIEGVAEGESIELQFVVRCPSARIVDLSNKILEETGVTSRFSDAPTAASSESELSYTVTLAFGVADIAQAITLNESLLAEFNGWLLARHARLTQAQASIRLNSEMALLDSLSRRGKAYANVYRLYESPIDHVVGTVLIEHLRRPDTPPCTRVDIARCLATNRAHYAWASLLENYNLASLPSELDAAAYALSEIASPEHRNDILSLVMDDTRGPSRQFLLAKLEELT